MLTLSGIMKNESASIRSPSFVRVLTRVTCGYDHNSLGCGVEAVCTRGNESADAVDGEAVR